MSHEQVLRIIRKAIEQRDAPPATLPAYKSNFTANTSVSILMNQASIAFIFTGVAALYYFENVGKLLDALILAMFLLLFSALIFGLYRDFSGFDEKASVEASERKDATIVSNNHRLSITMWEERYFIPLKNAVKQLQESSPELGISVTNEGVIMMNPEEGIQHELLEAYSLHESKK